MASMKRSLMDLIRERKTNPLLLNSFASQILITSPPPHRLYYRLAIGIAVTARYIMRANSS